MGRKAELIAPVTMETAISKVKSHLSLTHVSVATAIGKSGFFCKNLLSNIGYLFV